jgi:hypothetical protein
MKRKTADAVAVTARSPINWLVGACLAAFLTAFPASAAVPQTGAGELNAAEKWVVDQVTAGKIADLSKQFPEETDRKLSAHFLEGLLTGTLPGVKLHRHGVRIIGAIIDEPVELRNAQVPCEVWLNNCKFNGTADFSSASFGGFLLFDNSAFKAYANFNSIKVRSTAFFRKAVFEGLVDFGFADITGNFEADEAQFKNKEENADFNSIKVGGNAFFRKAVFEGPLTFNSANITRFLDARKAQFNSKEQVAYFDGMKVEDAAVFEKAVFEGPVDFFMTCITGNFRADEAQFKNKEKNADFNSIKVGGNAFFRKAVFEGPVNFTSADIASRFRADEAQFKNKEKTANFNSMKVRESAFFRNAVFEGPVSFDYAEFVWLDLSSPFWPKIAGKLSLSGMSYKYVRTVPENEPESHKVLLTLADQSAYTADVYTNLEEFFKRQGYRADADRAFIAGKCRDRKEYFHSGDWGRWLGSWMLYLLVGYGRHPERAGYVGISTIVLGCILFPLKKMELQDPKELEKPEEKRRQYNRFWYSLGLFLPVVDLKTSELWGPKRQYRFLRNYVRVHILLGWILVPLVLAALTGLIK